MPKINWDAVEENDFTPVPEGQYLVSIEEVTVKETKNKDEMWVLKLNIEDEAYKGLKLFTNLVFTEKGFGNIKKLYSAIFGTRLPKNCDTSDIEDKKVVVDVQITEYNGKKQNNIPYAGFYKAETDEEEFI